MYACGIKKTNTPCINFEWAQFLVVITVTTVSSTFGATLVPAKDFNLLQMPPVQITGMYSKKAINK